jgi:hypothetical protein
LKAAGFRRLFRYVMPITAFMLHGKRRYAAMQTNRLLLASGIHKLIVASALPNEKATPMPKTGYIGLAPPTTLLGRFLAALDCVLMASAQAAIRNGDLPYFGL